MAATSEVDALPDELCPECGSGFAQDRKGRGYRRHLENRPQKDKNGDEVKCGWGRGHRD